MNANPNKIYLWGLEVLGLVLHCALLGNLAIGIKYEDQSSSKADL
jgi:hypothetical protein